MAKHRQTWKRTLGQNRSVGITSPNIAKHRQDSRPSSRGGGADSNSAGSTKYKITLSLHRLGRRLLRAVLRRWGCYAPWGTYLGWQGQIP